MGVHAQSTPRSDLGGRPGEPGYCVHNQHELLLVGVRGDAPTPIPGTEQPSIIAAAVRDDIAQFITEMFPDLPKAKLFSPKRWTGWDVWQPEVGSDDGAKPQDQHLKADR